MPPSISVVIPLHNARQWIGETLRSVFLQTCPKDAFEVIVIDDASTDDGAEIARSLLAEHGVAGQVVSRERNAGVSAARNLGWQLAKGGWIQFLDADDLLAPRKIEVQAAAASSVRDDVAVIYSPWQHYRLLGGSWGAEGPLVDPAVSDDAVLRILQDDYFGYLGPTLIRSSALREVSGLDERLKLGEDFDLMLRIAARGSGFHKVPSLEPLFFYRDTPASLWRRAVKNPQSMRDLVRIPRAMEDYLRTRSAAGLSQEERIALAKRYAKGLDFFFEHDRASFQETLDWIRALGLEHPPLASRRLRLTSRLLGYENALGLRFSLRRVKRRLGVGREA
jgi:glycosyltransferase involved in cell wall biosynthesis